jgi:hypothetical protein
MEVLTMDFSMIDYASTDFGSINTPSGSLSVERDYIAIAAHPDPRVRGRREISNGDRSSQIG